MGDSKSRIATAIDKLAEMGEIKCRSQFGGYSLSVDNVVFALVAEGEMYLRACEEVSAYLSERKTQAFTFNRGGIPVELNYFRVEESLWQETPQLLALSQRCLQGAQLQRKIRCENRRLKDLPNLTMRLEVLLRHVGIHSVRMLKEQGAKRSWLKLHARNKNLGINVLFALEGAILGQHHEALPDAVKAELRHWYSETLQLSHGVKKLRATQ